MKTLLAIFSIFATAYYSAHAQQPSTSKAVEFFNKMDADKDGALSLDEFKTGLSAQKNAAVVEEYFRKLDQNADGKISLVEYTARDTQQPAPVTKQPPAPVQEKKPVAEEPPRNIEPKRPAAPPEEKHFNPDASGLEHLFKKLDVDGNGTLSKKEFLDGPMAQKNPDRAKEYFKKLDKDGSGDLSQEEFTTRPNFGNDARPDGPQENPHHRPPFSGEKSKRR